MIFDVVVKKEIDAWIASFPVIGIQEKGETEKRAVKNLLKAVEGSLSRVDDKRPMSGLVYIERGIEAGFFSKDLRLFVSLILGFLRSQSGLSVREVARAMDNKSPRSYAQYEDGSRLPKIETLERLFRIFSPGADLMIKFLPAE